MIIRYKLPEFMKIYDDYPIKEDFQKTISYRQEKFREI